MGDFHMCPMVTPGVPPIPHVGGPISLGMPTVLIGNMPAATLGSMCVCVGPPDTIILGSMGVLIGGKPAARMGDMCAHGGMVAVGFPTVIIGEISPGGPNPVVVLVTVLTSIIQSVVIQEQRGGQDVVKLQKATMMLAAAQGTPLVHNSCSCPSCVG
jgi:uncharacterized Zn-binding protein involved in type VI secretion